MAFLLIFSGCTKKENKKENFDLENKTEVKTDLKEEKELSEDEFYYKLEDVAKYIHIYEKLPKNYIKKSEADKIGWSVKNSEGLVIGGDEFKNREKILPQKEGRKYFEADLQEGYSENRGPMRIVYSNDGLIFYTKDHYKSFEQLY